MGLERFEIGTRWLMPIFGSRRAGVRYWVEDVGASGVLLRCEADGHALTLTADEAERMLEPLDEELRK